MTLSGDMVYSANGEDEWTEDLAYALSEKEEGDLVWGGVALSPSVSTLVDSDDIIDMLADRAYDNFGEWTDGWPAVTTEARTELDNLLQSWITKHTTPASFYTVGSITSWVVTKEDLE